MDRLKFFIVFTAFLFLCVVARIDAAVPPMLSIQGKLTDPQGAHRDGTFKFVFTIYDASIDGTNLWKKTYSDVAVKNGNFQVSVGNPNGKDDAARDLSIVFTGANRWVGIQVQSSNGALEPEFLPRQQLVTVAHAFMAGNAQHSEVADRLSVQEVPVGTILDWYRPDAETVLPDGFQMCDGSLITDSASPMKGKNTPNLIDKITYGVSENRVGEMGGANSINLQHSHIVNSHTHSIVHTHTFAGVTGTSNQGSSSAGGNAGPVLSYNAHDHSYSGAVSASSIESSGSASPSTDSQLSTSVDNRQAYIGVLKIIKVR